VAEEEAVTKVERDELDAKVLAAVRLNNNRLTLVAKACGIQGLAAIDAGHPETRKIDRSLQRLRKAGRIHYLTPGGWQEVQS
jgi:hypothetical protein